MDIHLTSDLEELVQRKLRSGYGSPDDVVRDALRYMDERDQLIKLYNHDVHKAVAEGLESLRRGEGIDTDEVFAELEADIDNWEKR